MKNKNFYGGVTSIEILESLEEYYLSTAEEELMVRKLVQKRKKQYFHPPTSWLINKRKERLSEIHLHRTILRMTKYKNQQEK